MIGIQDIYEAYRKLKSYFYYDNTSHFTRMKIAEFEAGLSRNNDSTEGFKVCFENAMDGLMTVLNKKNGWEKIWKRWLKEDIGCVVLPKDLGGEREEYSNGMVYVNNKAEEKEIKVDSVNAVIDASVMIHIISVLWIMKVGLKLASLVDANNYAYRLATHENMEDDIELDNGLAIYKPYFTGYQSWRDNALKKAKSLLNEKKDVTIVSLDIKRYFYSARLNVEKLVSDLSSKDSVDLDMNDKDVKTLNTLLDDIHRVYAEKANRYVSKAGYDENGYSIPVGLMSSGLLANLYLENFDRNVTEKLRPDYYGRYVDDMIFVFSNIQVDSPQEFIDNVFCGKTIGKDNCTFLEKDVKVENDNQNEYRIAGYPGLVIQSKKIVLEYFEHTGSTALIDKFVNTILKNRSEFRFLPDEDLINRDFEDSAFTLQYSGSFNKLRSIENFKEDKFGASRYLANQIFLSSYQGNDNNLEKTDGQILAFFRGEVAISFHSLWEKVATYFIMNHNNNGLGLFITKVKAAIQRIDCRNEDILEKVKKDLEEYLYISVAIPLSLNLKFKQRRKYSISIEERARRIRMACMSRRQLMNIDLFDMMKSLDIEGRDLYNISPMSFEEKELAFSAFKRLLCPQYIHLDSICQINMLKALSSFDGIKNNLTHIVLENSKKDFELFNFEWRHLFENYEEDNWLKAYIYEKSIGDNKSYVTINERDADGKILENKRVAIANLKVDTDIIRKMVYGRQCLTTERKKELFAVINEAVKHNSDLLVMPELATPFQWLSLLTRESKKANMGIVSGLTYICNSNKIAFNVVVAVLPIRVGHCMECVMLPRVKNHYAPREIDVLKGYRYDVPTFKKPVYQLIHWRRLYFSIYNCFELASIEDRSLFKSETDLIIATELNRDLNYFSEIAGSWVRDIHSYFIQVNSSEFGDSRIMRPTGKERRDMVVVKGGKNPIAIIDDLDVHSLRDFQLKEHNLQMQSKETFKLTPPNYSVENVKKRVNNEEMV